MYPAQRSTAERPPSGYGHDGTPPSQPPPHGYPSQNQAPRPGLPPMHHSPRSPQMNRSQPTSPSATRAPLPPLSHAQERPSSGFYDPIMDGRPRPYEQDRAYPAPRSPLQVRSRALARIRAHTDRTFAVTSSSAICRSIVRT